MSLKIGIDGAPSGLPFPSFLANAQNYEKDGFDSIFIPDSFMGYLPEYLWVEELIDAAKVVKEPNAIYDIVCVLASTALTTKKILFGSGVADTSRRHPVILAQTYLTLHNMSRGRVILGLGSGERIGNEPYGFTLHRAFARFKESVEVIKLLWTKKKNVNYDGEFFKLKSAMLALPSFKRKNQHPPLWFASHGEKMLKFTGKEANGWYPVKHKIVNGESYKRKLEIIKKSAKECGRELDGFVPALWSFMVIDDDEDEIERIKNSTIAKFGAFFLNSEMMNKEHPLGKDYDPMFNFLPSEHNKEEMLKIFEEIPSGIFEKCAIVGTPDQIINQIEDFSNAGMQHIVLQNMTYIVDSSKIHSSHKLFLKVLNYFKDLR